MKHGRVSAVALAVVAAMVVAGCGSSAKSGTPKQNGPTGTNTASAPGITATTVTIGSHQPLTGPAAPGYGEIAPASNAFFQYVNANGGVYGRKIVYKYLDDGYNPATTVSVVQQLVLQDHVFAIFSGLGTPTHTKVVGLLNAEKVPDLFVSSGCVCWDDPSHHPYTFGWQPDYIVEGKILGQYVKQHFAGKKIGYFYQDDDFGQDGVRGLDKEIPASQVVSRQPYQLTALDVSAQVGALQRAGAQVVVAFSIPAYTALLRLFALKSGYSPQLVVSNVGSDPITLTGLLEAFAKKGGVTLQGSPLIQGIVTAAYLPTTADPSNSWIQLFKRVHDQYLPKLPLDGNVIYGMAEAYTFVQALQAAGRNPTRQGIVTAIEQSHFTGPGLVPFRFSTGSHAGYTGTEVGVISGESIKLVQSSPMTTDDGNGPVSPYTATPAVAPPNGIPTPGA